MNRAKLLLLLDPLLNIAVLFLVWWRLISLFQWAIIHVLGECLLYFLELADKKKGTDMEEQLTEEMTQNRFSFMLGMTSILSYAGIFIFGWRSGQFGQALLAFCAPFVFHFFFKKLL